MWHEMTEMDALVTENAKLKSDLEESQAALQDSRAASHMYRQHIEELQVRRDALLKEVEGLEAVVARLEAEDLQPLVDRLRAQIAAIKEQVTAMALALAEILKT
jgi:chromosome segregation ATPase